MTLQDTTGVPWSTYRIVYRLLPLLVAQHGASDQGIDEVQLRPILRSVAQLPRPWCSTGTAAALHTRPSFGPRCRRGSRPPHEAQWDETLQRRSRTSLRPGVGGKWNQHVGLQSYFLRRCLGWVWRVTPSEEVRLEPKRENG